MWIRQNCPACGAANLLPEKKPAHAEACAECDKPLPDPRAATPAPVPLTPMPSPFMAKAPRKQTGNAGLFVAFCVMACVVFGAGVAVGVFVVAPRWRPETPNAVAVVPGPTPTEISSAGEPEAVLPAKPQISWRTFRDERGGFSVEYPEQIKEPTSALPVIEKDSGRVHGNGPGGVMWDVRYEGYFINFTEAQLMHWAGVNSRGKESLTRKDIRFGNHPGFEHTLNGLPGGETRPVRSRVIVVGKRLYEVSVLANPKAAAPAGWEERFLDSFRLLAEPGSVFAEHLGKDRQPVWRESWSIPGNFAVTMPGRATELKTKSSGADRELDATSRTVDAKGTEFLARSLFHAGPLQEGDLLEEVGVKELAKFAIWKQPLKHGAHSGIDFIAAATPDGSVRAVRSKIIAAGSRLYQLSVVSPTVAAPSEKDVTRFFDSFRLVRDPATAFKDPFTPALGGWKTHKNVEWNFTADFPGILHNSAPKQVLDNSPAWEVSSLDQGSRVSASVTVVRYREDLTGADLLEQMGTKRLTTPATKAADVKLGDHPGKEFLADPADKGEQRTRVFAVGSWLYELRLASRGGNIPEPLAVRFFESFKLLDPAGHR